MDENNRVNLDKDAYDKSMQSESSLQSQDIPQHGGTEDVSFQPNMAYVPDENSEKTIVIFSVISGSAAILLTCVPILPFIFGVVGLVLAIIQLKERQGGHDLAKIGMVLSIIGIVLPFVITLLACLVPTALYTIQNAS